MHIPRHWFLKMGSVTLLILAAAPAPAQTCTRICCVHHFKIIHGFLADAAAAQQRAAHQTAAQFGASYTRQTAVTFMNLTASELLRAAAHFGQLHDPANQAAVTAMAGELSQAAQAMQAAKSDAAALAILLHTNLALKIPPAVAPVSPAAAGAAGKAKK
jgi:hypothetical protein